MVKHLHVYGNHYLHASQYGVVPGGDEATVYCVFVEKVVENKIEWKKTPKKCHVVAKFSGNNP